MLQANSSKQADSPNGKRSSSTSSSISSSTATGNKEQVAVASTKSVAQRVMEVTNSAKSASKLKNNNSTNSSRALINDHDDDLEVEDLTSKVAKSKIMEQQQQQSTTSTGTGYSNDRSNDQNNNNLQQRYSNSSSPSLVLMMNSPEPGSSQQEASNNTNGSCQHKNMQQHSLIGSEPIFKQIVSTNKKITSSVLASSDGSCSKASSAMDQMISLDTKVPLHNNTTIDDEVSYYNDTQIPFSLEANKHSGRTGPTPAATKNDSVLGENDELTRSALKQARKTTEMNIYDLDESNYYGSTTINDNDEQAACRQQQGFLSIPNSPKAKSAPTTPYNVTPIAFHQNRSHLEAFMKASPANTLPPDIRKNISATCRKLPSSRTETSLVEFIQYLDEQSLNGQSSMKAKNYEAAIEYFSNCIEFAKQNGLNDYLERNFKLYYHRAEANYELANYSEAVSDSIEARAASKNSKFTQAFHLQGKSQFKLCDYAASLAVLSFALSLEPTNKDIYDTIVEIALESSQASPSATSMVIVSTNFKEKYQLLQAQKADKKFYILVAILGQDLLTNNQFSHAVVVLESALKIENFNNNNQHQSLSDSNAIKSIQTNKRFKLSILSSLSNAYCLMQDYNKAIQYMLQELELEEHLEDVRGKCRILGNLGYTYFKLRMFDKSLEFHRKQVDIAMKTQLYQQAHLALNAMGHIHAAKNDHSNALTSHTRCYEILKQLNDNDFNLFKELLAIGHFNSMLGFLDLAREKFSESIQFLKQSNRISSEECQTGLIMAYFNLAHLGLKRQSLQETESYFEKVIELATAMANNESLCQSENYDNLSKSSKNKALLYQMRAFNGLGQAYRIFKKYERAGFKFEKQLELAECLNDLSAKSQALCNLGIINQHLKNYDVAMKFFNDNLNLIQQNKTSSANSLGAASATHSPSPASSTSLSTSHQTNNQLLKAYAYSYLGSIYFLKGDFSESKRNYEQSLKEFAASGYCSSEEKIVSSNLAAVKEKMNQSNNVSIETMNATATTTSTSYRKKQLVMG